MEMDENSTLYYLSICSPQEAAEWLQKRARSKNSYRNSVALDKDDKYEAVLLCRNDPRIDFALAQHCFTTRTGSALYQKGILGLRCALLRHFPTGGLTIFTNDDVFSWRTNAEFDEIQSLLANPRIADGYLEGFLSRSDCYQAMSDGKYLSLMPIVGANPRMQKERADSRFDGWDEYRYNEVFHKAWELTQSAPLNQQWAEGLYFLLNKAHRLSRFDAHAAILRWRIDIENPSGEAFHWPGYSLHLRSRIADLLKATPELACSDDLALRMSYYRRLNPAKDHDWHEYLKRDSNDFIDAILWNQTAWKTETGRSLLSEICWDAPDPDHGMMAPNQHRAMEDRMRGEHPDWFTERLPEADAQITSISERLDIIEQRISEFVKIKNNSAKIWKF